MLLQLDYVIFRCTLYLIFYASIIKIIEPCCVKSNIVDIGSYCESDFKHFYYGKELKITVAFILRKLSVKDKGSVADIYVESWSRILYVGFTTTRLNLCIWFSHYHTYILIYLYRFHIHLESMWWVCLELWPFKI